MIFKLRTSSRSRILSLKLLPAILKNSAAQYIYINPPFSRKSHWWWNDRSEGGEMTWEKCLSIMLFWMSSNPGNGLTVFRFHPVAGGAVESCINSEKIARCSVQFDETSLWIHELSCDKHELAEHVPSLFCRLSNQFVNRYSIISKKRRD